MYKLLSLICISMVALCVGVKLKSGLTEYKGHLYKFLKRDNQDPSLECQIPPIEEEDLTHFRRKRMIAEHGRACLEDYPYLLSVRFNDTFVCLGVMLHNQYALTVSDCVKDVKDPKRPVELSVRVGSVFRDFGGRLLSVIEIFLHPKNGTGDFSQRIVMLKTNLFISATPNMIPVVLPFPRMNLPTAGQLVVSGYGNDNETGEVIEWEEEQQWHRRTFVREVPKEECLQRMNNTSFHDDYLCIERSNETEDELYLCPGDMGAPLVHYEYKHFTPVILGLSLTAVNGCLNETLNKGADGKLLPAIFLKVSEYRGWLDAVFKSEAAKEEIIEYNEATECEQYPKHNVNFRYLRRKKRLTAETALTCLEDYPYTASIRLHGMHWCGGAIIADDWILTSAQCFDDTNKEDVTVRLGSVFRDYGGWILSVVALVKHPKYKRGGDYPAYNLAMLQTNMPIFPSQRVQIVKLIPPISIRIENWGGENIVTGYGAVKSPVLEEGVNQELRKMSVIRVPRDECQKYYEGITEIKQDQICMRSLIEGVTLCTGDLGDPLVQFNSYAKEGILFGLAIFPGSGGCNSTRPSIFTKIRPSWLWIDGLLRDGPPKETEPPPLAKPVLRAETSSYNPLITRRNHTKDDMMFSKKCIIHPRFEVDLRHVNLTATRRRRRRRRKRMTLSGKAGLVCLEDYPYTVAILKDDEEVICSGVIIARQWVLTAAVCIEKCSLPACHNLTSYHQLSIRMGSIFGRTGGRLVAVVDFRVHPEFKPKRNTTTDYGLPRGDLAMLKFNIPYRPSPRMQRVQLPKEELDSYLREQQHEGKYIVSGFGGKRSGQREDGFNDIRAMEVEWGDFGWTPLDCFKHHQYYFTVNVGPYRHLVMKTKDPYITFCVGDNGSPLVHFRAENSKPTLYGIHVNYWKGGGCYPLPPVKFDDRCNNSVGFFVRVASYVRWIENVLEEDEEYPHLVHWRETPEGLPITRFEEMKSKLKRKEEEERNKNSTASNNSQSRHKLK